MEFAHNILRPKPRRPEYKPKKPVTIAIGILAQKSIVMAADSQTTRGNIKYLDAVKIRVLQLKNARTLVAEAGNVGNCQRVIEIMEGMAKDVELSDYRTVADIARQAMIKVREELREQRGNCTQSELDDFLLQYEQQAELMIAHFFEGKPLIYIADLFTGSVNKVADREHSQFAAIGSGAQTAEYILSKLNIPEIDARHPWNNIEVTAMYIIEEVKRLDTYCGGLMSIALLHSGNECGGVIPPNPNMENQIALIKAADKNFSAEWARKMENIITNIVKAVQTGTMR
jgi:20S proteasome alpha/beta subunit